MDGWPTHRQAGSAALPLLLVVLASLPACLALPPLLLVVIGPPLSVCLSVGRPVGLTLRDWPCLIHACLVGGSGMEECVLVRLCWEVLLRLECNVFSYWHRGYDEQRGLAVFLQPALLNHSCSPNTAKASKQAPRQHCHSPPPSPSSSLVVP